MLKNSGLVLAAALTGAMAISDAALGQGGGGGGAGGAAGAAGTSGSPGGNGTKGRTGAGNGRGANIPDSTTPAQRQTIDNLAKELTTGQSPTTGNETNTDNTQITLSEQQRTGIRAAIMRDRAIPRVNDVTFAVSVGSPVPSSTPLAAIPPHVLQIYPRFRGDRVVVVGNQIVIVDPTSYRIVAVLSG
jgi:Protein of unknown function (DUF1236)